MCGIAGSFNKEQAFKLYQTNLCRGFYSSGYFGLQEMYSSRPRPQIKVLGVFNESQGYPDMNLFHFYHSRGPTVETNGFIPENNHPFDSGDWIVAHNGIISNFDELCRKYFPNENFEGKTDSCIIPRLLTALLIMPDVLGLLKGTFAIWAYNKKCGKTYLARCGSTLFANIENGDFCSTQFEGSVPLDEGVIYDISNYSSIKRINSFNFNSPYLVL